MLTMETMLNKMTSNDNSIKNYITNMRETALIQPMSKHYDSKALKNLVDKHKNVITRKPLKNSYYVNRFNLIHIEESDICGKFTDNELLTIIYVGFLRTIKGNARYKKVSSRTGEITSHTNSIDNKRTFIDSKDRYKYFDEGFNELYCDVINRLKKNDIEFNVNFEANEKRSKAKLLVCKIAFMGNNALKRVYFNQSYDNQKVFEKQYKENLVSVFDVVQNEKNDNFSLSVPDNYNKIEYVNSLYDLKSMLSNTEYKILSM
jgi:hypothetical protein